MQEPLPIVGAAFDMETLEAHRAWVLERQRDVELQHFIAPEVLLGDWQPLAARTRALLDGHTGRLGLHGPFVSLAIDAVDPEVRGVVQQRFGQGLDVCAALGATQMVVHSPFTTWDAHNLGANAGGLDGYYERVHGTLGPLVRRAETLGVELVLENIEDRDPMARVGLARSFCSAAVRVSLDTGHANYAHRATGAPPVDYHVVAAGDLLAHVHLQDSDGYADRHWCPGEGNVPWPALFTALAALKSRPRLILELRDKMQVRRAAAWLEEAGLAS